MQYSLPLKNLLEPIRQPTGLAILASLGIHGIVGVSFESLPMFARTPKEKQNTPVRMVQLTPEQLSRLQPPPRTELTLPLLPAQAQLPSTPTPSINPGTTVTPQPNPAAGDLPPPPPVTIPSWPASSTLSTNPNWLPPPPREQPSWPPMTNTNPLPNWPTQPDVSIVPNWSPPPLPPPPTGTRGGPQMGGADNWGTQLPPPIPSGNLGGSGQNGGDNDFGRTFNPPPPVFPQTPPNESPFKFNPDPGLNVNGNNLPSGNGNAGGRDNNNNWQRPDSPLPTLPQMGEGVGENPFAAVPPPETTPPQPIQPPNTATGSTTPPTTPPEQRTNLNDNRAISGLLAEMRQQQGTKYSALGTTAEWANMRFQSWLNHAQNLSGNSELLWQQKTKEVEYPPEASQIDLKEDPIVAIAVLVAPDGSIAYGPDLIQSSGYDILNAKALESVKNFEGTGQYEAYSYRVRFTANGEPSPETPATGQETPTENPNNVSSPPDSSGSGEETLPEDNTPESTERSSPPAAPTTEAPGNRETGSSGPSPVRAREDGQTPPDVVGEDKPAGDAAPVEDKPAPNGAEGDAVSDSPPPIPAEDAVGEEKPAGDAAAVEDKPSPNGAEGEAVSEPPPPIPAEDVVGEEKPAGDAAAVEDKPRGDASALEFQEGVEDMPY